MKGQEALALKNAGGFLLDELTRKWQAAGLSGDEISLGHYCWPVLLIYTFRQASVCRTCMDHLSTMRRNVGRSAEGDRFLRALSCWL